MSDTSVSCGSCEPVADGKRAAVLVYDGAGGGRAIPVYVDDPPRDEIEHWEGTRFRLQLTTQWGVAIYTQTGPDRSRDDAAEGGS